MNRKTYNQEYYLKNRTKLLEIARKYYFSTKKPCPNCNKLISRVSKKCIKCTLIERNRSEKQRECVKKYWRKNKFRSSWLKELNEGNIKQLSESEVKNLESDWLRLLGWILTDGYIRKRWGNIVIYQTKEWGKDKIRKILESLNLKWKEYKVNESGEVMFYIPSKDSRRIIETLCLKEKKLPEWTKYLTKNQIKNFLESLLDGDGHRGKYHTCLTGRYEKLKSIFNLLISKGISCSLTTNKRGDSYIYIHQGQL